MRERNIQINFRVTKSEKQKIHRKAKRCGLTEAEYIRNCALDRIVMEMPKEGLRKAYRNSGVVLKYLERYSDTGQYVQRMKETLQILLDIYNGKEVEDDGCDENMADQGQT